MIIHVLFQIGTVLFFICAFTFPKGDYWYGPTIIGVIVCFVYWGILVLILKWIESYHDRRIK